MLICFSPNREAARPNSPGWCASLNLPGQWTTMDRQCFTELRPTDNASSGQGASHSLMVTA